MVLLYTDSSYIVVASVNYAEKGSEVGGNGVSSETGTEDDYDPALVYVAVDSSWVYWFWVSWGRRQRVGVYVV